MNKYLTDQGCNQVRANYGESLNFIKDKQCESSIPMKTDKNRNSVGDAQEHMKDELQKKKETTKMLLQNNEQNNDYKKTNSHSRNEWRSSLQSNKNINQNNSSSSDE